MVKLHVGNSEEVLQGYLSNSFGSIVTDPPYGLEFMGEEWDKGVPAVSIWRECLRVLKPGGYMLAFGGSRTFHNLVSVIEEAGFEIRDTLLWLYGTGFPKSQKLEHGGEEYGTALKPAYEPICLARKPFKGTVKDNFELHGTGVLNIGACRIGSEVIRTNGRGKGCIASPVSHDYQGNEHVGRFPSNVLVDSCTADLLDSQKEDISRLFYCPKVSAAECSKTDCQRSEHSTMKPIELMRYLVRLVTPKGQVVLDPFVGSGSTLIASHLEGFDSTGIDLNEDYVALAGRRLAAVGAHLSDKE